MNKILWLIARSQWDRLIALGAALIAFIALGLGWFGVARTSYLAEQIPFVVSGGILGILLMALAATLWLSADLRDEWRKLDELGEKLDALSGAHQPADNHLAVRATAPESRHQNGNASHGAGERATGGAVL